MRHRTKTVQKANWVELIKSTNPKTGRVHYIVQVDPYGVSVASRKQSILGPYNGSIIDEVRSHFDPHHTRGGKYGTKWKFRNRAEAEKLIIMALLKFGA